MPLVLAHKKITLATLGILFVQLYRWWLQRRRQQLETEKRQKRKHQLEEQRLLERQRQLEEQLEAETRRHQLQEQRQIDEASRRRQLEERRLLELQEQLEERLEAEKHRCQREEQLRIDEANRAAKRDAEVRQYQLEERRLQDAYRQRQLEEQSAAEEGQRQLNLQQYRAQETERILVAGRSGDPYKVLGLPRGATLQEVLVEFLKSSAQLLSAGSALYTGVRKGELGDALRCLAVAFKMIQTGLSLEEVMHDHIDPDSALKVFYHASNEFLGKFNQLRGDPRVHQLCIESKQWITCAFAKNKQTFQECIANIKTETVVGAAVGGGGGAALGNVIGEGLRECKCRRRDCEKCKTADGWQNVWTGFGAIFGAVAGAHVAQTLVEELLSELDEHMPTPEIHIKFLGASRNMPRLGM